MTDTRTCSSCGRPLESTVDDDAVCEGCAASRGGAEVIAFPPGGREPELDELISDEEFLQQWDEAEQGAVVVLREALAGSVGAPSPAAALTAAADRVRAGVAAGDWPYRHLANAAGWAGTAPQDDRQCCVEAAGGLVALREESGLDPEQESTLMALELSDWAGAVIGLVRSGAGAPADTGALIDYVETCPEIDGELDPDDTELIASAFETVLHGWVAVGAVDSAHRLTELGEWLLPRALAWAWGSDFDA